MERASERDGWRQPVPLYRAALSMLATVRPQYESSHEWTVKQKQRQRGGPHRGRGATTSSSQQQHQQVCDGGGRVCSCLPARVAKAMVVAIEWWLCRGLERNLTRQRVLCCTANTDKRNRVCSTRAASRLSRLLPPPDHPYPTLTATTPPTTTTPTATTTATTTTPTTTAQTATATATTTQAAALRDVQRWRRSQQHEDIDDVGVRGVRVVDGVEWRRQSREHDDGARVRGGARRA